MAEDKSFLRKTMDAMITLRSREAARGTDRVSRIYGCDFGASRKGAAQ